jgi:hypothetical protein
LTRRRRYQQFTRRCPAHTYAEATRFGGKHAEAFLDPGIVADTADGVVELVFVADGPCTGSDGKFSWPQDKVQTYVFIAVDAQVGRSHPDAVEVTGRVEFESHVVRVPARTEALGNEAVTADSAAQLAARGAAS